MNSVLKALRAGLVGSVALVAGAGSAYAADLSYKDDPVVEEGRKWGVSFTAAATTDYVFRGISQTQEEGTLQASVDVTYGIAYFGIWGSGIDFDDPNASDVEIDFYAGIKPTWNSVTFDFGVIYYMYPGADDDNAALGELDYVEFKAAASTKVFSAVDVGVAVFYSPEFTGATGEAVAVEGTVAKTLPKFMRYDVTASALIGFQSIEEGDDYTYWNVGLSTTVDKFTFDVRYWDTDIDNVDIAEERIVGTVKVTLP